MYLSFFSLDFLIHKVGKCRDISNRDICKQHRIVEMTQRGAGGMMFIIITVCPIRLSATAPTCSATAVALHGRLRARPMQNPRFYRTACNADAVL